MPSLLDYLFTPWKIIEIFTGPPAAKQAAALATQAAAAVAPPAAAAKTAASWQVCYYSDMGGQVLHVCNVGGYEMPSFIFFACLIMLVAFFLASRKLIRECREIADALTDVARAVSKLQTRKSGGLSKQDVAGIGAAMAKHKCTAEKWEQFEETLLSSPHSEEMHATAPVEKCLPREAFVEDNINTALFGAIPGVLTGVGLLLTFVAILAGLAHVSVGQNMDVQGIAGLINGLSGKFASSIVAISCAVGFIFIERYAYARPHAAYRKLISLLAARFRVRTAEHLLHSIYNQLAGGRGRGD